MNHQSDVTQPADAASHYDRVTSAWAFLLGEDFHYGLFTHPGECLATATANLTSALAEHGDLSPGQRILDVGCGTGMPALWLAQKLGCRVIGITLSPNGVAAARARAAREGLTAEYLNFELRDGQNNGFPAGTFDRIWVMESSHLMPQKNALLAECARVLRPGGKIVLCDIIRRTPLPVAEVLRRAQDFALLHRVFGKARMATFDEYAQWADAAGLQTVKTIDISEATRPTFERWSENAQLNADIVTKLVGNKYLAEFRQSCEVLDNLWGDRTLGYGIFVATKPSI